MTLTYVLMQNLKRNPLRTALTAIAFAFPMAVFVAAIAFVVAMVRLSQANAQELRLVVRHKATLTNYLPEGNRRKIEALDPDRTRLKAICGMRWFGGRVPDSKIALTNLAVDPDTFPIVYSDLAMTEDETALWHRERRAAVIGSLPASAYGWKVGDRVTLNSTVPPYLSLEFQIVCISPNPVRANFFFFRRDYLDESLVQINAPSGRVNTFWIKCTSVEAIRSLQQQIDAMFANSPDETKSEDENAFVAGFIQATGDIPALMQAMAIVVVFIVALIAGNAMMMSFRERVRELAVFKAIGFPSLRVFFIVITESLMLALFGAMLGVVPASVLLLIFPGQELAKLFGVPIINQLRLSWPAVVGALAIAAFVGLVAGFWPAWQALRLKTVDAIRHVA